MAIDLDKLIDFDVTFADGGCPWTFFAWPTSTNDENGLPKHPEARKYIAAVQAAGVPVGVCHRLLQNNTSYAGVEHDSIPHLHRVLETLTEFGGSFAIDLCEQLFRDAAS